MKILYLISFFLLVIPTIHGQLDWQDTDGPPGNLYLEFYMHGDSTYAASHSTIFRYVDDSLQWQKVEKERVDFIDSYGDKAIAVSTYDQDEVIIKQSADKSRSWETLCAFSNDSLYFEDLAADSTYYYLLLNPIDPNSAFVTLRAKYGSCNWDTLTTPISFWHLRSFNDRLYGFSLSSLYYSEDQGNSWTELHSNPPNTRNFINDVFVQDSFIIISKENGVIYSFDFGGSWHTLVSSSGSGICSNFTFSGGHPRALINNKLYTILGEKQINVQSLERQFYECLFRLNETIATNVINKGVYKWSSSEEQFRPAFNGINEGYLFDMSFQEDTLYALTAAGVYRYDMNQDEWIDQIYQAPKGVESYFIETSEAGWIVVINLFSNGFFLSKDWGRSWKFVREEGIGYKLNDEEPLKLKDSILFYTGYYLGRSADGGETIEDLKHVHANKHGVVKFKKSLYVTFNDVLYIGDETGLNWDSLQLDFRADKLIPSENMLIAREFVYPQDHTFYYSRNGTHWSDLKLPMGLHKGPRYYPIVWNYKDAFYLAADDTLYKSTDLSNTWSIIDVDPPNDYITPHDSLLFTYYYGLFRAVLPEHTTSAPSLHDLSAEFSVTCFPNPASRHINVSIQSKQLVSDLTLLLFDNKGRLHYEQEMLPGSMATKIDVSHFQSGSYFLIGISPAYGISSQKVIIQ